MKETFDGKTAWDGTVEIYRLVDHPEATLCYAWFYDDDDGIRQLKTVLDLGPVDSAVKAVRTAIAADHQG